jgi:hypothetical protein
MKKLLDSLTRIGKLQANAWSRTLAAFIARTSAGGIERRSAGDIRGHGVGDLAYGPQARLAARHVGALQRRLDSLAREQETARRSVAEHGTRAKLAERAIEIAALRYRRHKERTELAELIERAIARRDVSST